MRENRTPFFNDVTRRSTSCTAGPATLATTTSGRMSTRTLWETISTGWRRTGTYTPGGQPDRHPGGTFFCAIVEPVGGGQERKYLQQCRLVWANGLTKISPFDLRTTATTTRANMGRRSRPPQQALFRKWGRLFTLLYLPLFCEGPPSKKPRLSSRRQSGPSCVSNP